MIELAQIVAGWPLALSMAAAVAVQGLRAGRRRSALNEALHELRRPLQVLALASGPQPAHAGGQGPVELATVALERLDREINGGPQEPVWGAIDGETLVRDAAARWRARARLCEAVLEVRWSAGGAALRGDRAALGQAL